MANRKIDLIELNETDSTNNYAMMLADGNKARHGLTITAQSQTGGRGQRGNSWIDEPGQNLLMSMITVPGRPITAQFVFNCLIATIICKIVSELISDCRVEVKWPNDIIVNDKKAGGLLIENVLRGSGWNYAIIGLGLNINQQAFPDSLPWATSIGKEAQTNFEIASVRDRIAGAVLDAVESLASEHIIMEQYNAVLFRRGQLQTFRKGNNCWLATVLFVTTDGLLQVKDENGIITAYRHGDVVWQYGA